MATPLLEFVKIGPRTSLYTPHQPATGKLIIICAWLGAARKHIVKYTTAYQKLAPEARILLIESDIPIITSRYKKQRELINSAVSIVLDTLSECGYYRPIDDNTTKRDSSQKLGSLSSSSTMVETAPKILLHMFSNGGTNSATQLLIVLEECLSQPLPVLGLLFDSCPSKGTYWKSHNSMALSLRPKDTISRVFGDIVVHCILIVLFTWIACGNDNPATLMRRTLLDDEKLTGISSGGYETKMQACYLFSEADEQTDWMDVKEHAEEARRKGWTVREVLFEGSGHCAHLLKGGERYVAAMKDVWLDTSK